MIHFWSQSNSQIEYNFVSLVIIIMSLVINTCFECSQYVTLDPRWHLLLLLAKIICILIGLRRIQKVLDYFRYNSIQKLSKYLWQIWLAEYWNNVIEYLSFLLRYRPVSVNEKDSISDAKGFSSSIPDRRQVTWFRSRETFWNPDIDLSSQIVWHVQVESIQDVFCFHHEFVPMKSQYLCTHCYFVLYTSISRESKNIRVVSCWCIKDAGLIADSSLSIVLQCLCERVLSNNSRT